MNRQDLKYLREQSGYPAVSITLPTHKTFPDNRQDPILLKNLLSRVEKGFWRRPTGSRRLVFSAILQRRLNPSITT